MKIFSNINYYSEYHRYRLNNIAKAFWNDRSIKERKQVYGEWVDLYQYEPDIKKTDVCILTYKWPYYIQQKMIPEAVAEVEAARKNVKPMVIFSEGDHPANIPFDDVILFEYAGYHRSTPGLRYHSSMPVFLADYLHIYCQDELQLRPKQDLPTVGFCGLANTSSLLNSVRKIRLKRRQRQYERGKLQFEPPPFETSAFRARVLKGFDGKPGIRTNFLIRKRYRAGVIDDKSPHHPSKVEFVNNILDSDYTVCMRGGGNFSVRFYETLSLGRIPIFIDTDCLLPFQDEIDYKSIFPWINMKDLPHAAEILRNFHARLSEDDFLDLQKACRRLWIEHMTPDGFHRDFVRQMKKIISSTMKKLN